MNTDALSITAVLSFSCRDLHSSFAFSKPSALIIVSERSLAENNLEELGRTEVIKKSQNPDFVNKVVMVYHFEEQQWLNFAVYNMERSGNSSGDENKKLLGSCEATLGEIISKMKIKKPLKMGTSDTKATITVVAEEVTSCKDDLILDIAARSLDKKDSFGSSDPFLSFYRVNEDNSRTIVHKTEVIKNSLNPNWKQLIIPMQVLVNGDYDRPLVIVCSDWNRSGKVNLIGEVTVTVNEMVDSFRKGNHHLELVNPEKRGKQKRRYTNSGTLHLNLVKVEKIYSFLEYVQGGTELCFSIAIDFTKSNGSPHVPGTLHYGTNNCPSQYAMAFQAVGEVISDYDSDNLFPVFGFGACVPPDNVVSHCFPLNGHLDNPYCQGIQGVMVAYAHALRTVQFHGPTNFAPIINTVASIAREAQNPGSKYFILLILTDGLITDLPDTKEAIVHASSLPLSIIIVGVGPANFAEMEKLDGDEIRLTSRGQAAIRDIVQFVPFRNFQDANSVQHSKWRLSKAVLAEIPDQLVSYMRMCQLKPGNRSAKFGRVDQVNATGAPYPTLNPPYPTPSAPPPE